jgi:hypothetical protein
VRTHHTRSAQGCARDSLDNEDVAHTGFDMSGGAGQPSNRHIDGHLHVQDIDFAVTVQIADIQRLPVRRWNDEHQMSCCYRENRLPIHFQSPTKHMAH